MTVGRVRLYRVTDAGDLLGNVAATEILDFNGGTKDSKIEKIVVTSLDVIPTEAIAKNPAIGQEFSNIQALGKFDKLYVLRGIVYRIQGVGNDGLNAFVTVFESFESGVKQNSIFGDGRFGIQIDDFRKYDIIPTESSTGDALGMVMLNIKWEIDWEASPPLAKFTMPLVVSRSDGT